MDQITSTPNVSFTGVAKVRNPHFNTYGSSTLNFVKRTLPGVQHSVKKKKKRGYILHSLTKSQVTIECITTMEKSRVKCKNHP